jgi:hypothetical protein
MSKRSKLRYLKGNRDVGQSLIRNFEVYRQLPTLLPQMVHPTLSSKDMRQGRRPRYSVGVVIQYAMLEMFE